MQLSLRGRRRGTCRGLVAKTPAAVQEQEVGWAGGWGER